MIKIGITGSSGILGRSLTTLLKKYPYYRIYTYKENILNIKKFNDWIKKNQFQIVIHLAALVPIKKVKKNYKLAKQINFIGTKNLINAIKNYQKKKIYIFFSSSSHVYSFNKNKIRETFKKEGISQYGKTKILAENMLLKNKKFFHLCIGRISSLTSEKQSTNFLLKKIIEFGKKNKNFNFGNSNIKRDFIYVEDVAKIITKSLIVKKIKTIHNYYKRILNKKPRIAVLGLNPHNAELRKNSEEVKKIIPAIKELTKMGIKTQGPLVPDTIFINEYKKFDVIVGMYHDQVLTPFKAMYKFDAINLTLGLNYLRVSPDHGVAINLIGKNKASENSLLQCIKFINKYG